MHCCRLVNVIKNKKQKKQPWGNVECFAFGGVTVRFASLETSFHAANHTIPPPPSYEGLPLCTKDKNRSPVHGEKPLMIGFSPKASGFYPFGDATDLAGEGGVGDVVWLIQTTD